MIRVMALATVLLGFTAPLPRFPASPPTLAEAGDSARAAWQRRDLAAFVAPALGGRLLITLPPGNQSAPIAADQARALLSSYVQGTQEVMTLLTAARAVDSLQGFVELSRRYRLVGIPGERQTTILLGYRRGRTVWVLTEVRIAP
ncbi:MAG TPA: hypothetical protein PLI70_09185 [Gemmatimonadales bacterium]|nr:hypothetical protein [Gemmatimonadales bacterium]HRZ09180.1 hypothetical protein [Gemmatimonadales bacterium]